MTITELQADQLTAILIEVFLFMGTLFAAYRRLVKKISVKLEEQTDDLKKYTDVTIRRLNGGLLAMIQQFHKPCWIKGAFTDRKGNVEFRMLEMNTLYEKRFGITRDKYVGRTDAEAGWPPITSQLFYAHDLKIWATGEAMTVREDIDGKPCYFHKFRVTSNDGVAKGVAGYEVDGPMQTTEGIV